MRNGQDLLVSTFHFPADLRLLSFQFGALSSDDSVPGFHQVAGLEPGYTLVLPLFTTENLARLAPCVRLVHVKQTLMYYYRK